jgi:hypothetical protein
MALFLSHFSGLVAGSLRKQNGIFSGKKRAEASAVGERRQEQLHLPCIEY